MSFALSEGMLFFMLFALALLPWNGVLGGQIPVVEGVLGGVPAPVLAAAESSQKTPMTTPGKLRVVENSGICGKSVSYAKLLFEAEDTLTTLETTPGVFQASGYADLTATDSIWYVCDPQYSAKA